MKTLIVSLITAILTLTSQARIGETMEECIKRYGDPRLAEGVKPGSVLFIKGSIGVIASFHEKKCDYIFYRKLDKENNGMGMPKEMSENEINFILKLNSGKGTWVLDEEDLVGKLWKNEDLKLFAYYHSIHRILSVCTFSAHERSGAEQDRKEIQGLEGL